MTQSTNQEFARAVSPGSATPVTPATPATPVTPETPAASETPATPATPTTPAPSAAKAYLRYPHVRGEHVVFTAANDVWLGLLTGGNAVRLTNEGAPVLSPFLSPDGQWVGFTSRASGRPEVWAVRADGLGDPRRLTAWGRPLTRTVGWLEDGRIIATSSEGMPMARDAQLWAVSLEGEAEPLPFGRAGEVASHPDGTTVVVTPYGRRIPAWWKHYQGGTAAKLWVSHEKVALDAPRDQHESRTWERLLDDVLGGKTRVFFYGDRLAFASDTPGQGAKRTDRASGNLWSVKTDGSDLRRHTNFESKDGYVREPASDGSTIVFNSRGLLYSMSSLDAEPQLIDMRTPGVGAERRSFLAEPKADALVLRPTRDARASVVEWRGSAHALTHRGGPSRLLAAKPEVRIREARQLGSTPYAVFVTDEGAAKDRVEGGVGSDQIAVALLDGSGPVHVLDVGNVGRILHLTPAPDGSSLAISTSDNVVHLVKVSGTAKAGSGIVGQNAPAVESITEVGRSAGGEVRSLAFSPDSRYLAFAEPNSWFLSWVCLVDTRASEPSAVTVTSGKYKDGDPVFSADGKYLAMVSLRTFETRYDDMVFDLGFVNAARPFLIPLERTTPDPFGPLPDGWGAVQPPEARLAHEGDAGEADAAEATPETAAGTAKPGQKDQPPATVIETEGLEARAVPFPVASGAFEDLVAVKDGFVWRRLPEQGELGSGRAGVEGEAPKAALEYWSFKDHKLTVLAEGVDAVEASADGESLVIRQGNEWVQVPAGRKVEADDPARVVIDVSRLRLMVDPVAERRGMLWDNYRIMAQQYWREDMDGQDWHAMTSWYEPVVERLVTRDDFEDMMWEVVGELGTSHAYVFGPAQKGRRETPQAYLGADIEVRDGKHVIARILPGDSSDPGARSPLLAPGVAADVGDAIVRVGGSAVGGDAGSSVAELLLGTAGEPTELVLERGGQERRVVVVPLESDDQLRYQDWVESRRRAVHDLSGGRLGYLHIPDMVSSGWAQMHRDLREAVSKDALVVDVRYNSGGHTSELVTDRLARHVRGWSFPRRQQPDTYPHFAPRGPVVLLTNQEAGSDGDIVNAVSKAMQIGPVIGTRTWGGVIGIDSRFDLVDGTGITEPKYAHWFEGQDWEVENYGVDPDIEVPFPPNAHVAGTDPQLERAVEEALALAQERPAAVAPQLPPPRFA